MMNIAFSVRQFTERGTEIAVYDYADYNEKILKNKSYIVYFSDDLRRRHGMHASQATFPKFSARFEMIQVHDMEDIPGIVEKYKLNYFYAQVSGEMDPMYRFNDKALWGPCKTIKHCVFNTLGREGDHFISISETLNTRFGTDVGVIPYIVHLPKHERDMRERLGIPRDAVVIGRHGAMDSFDVGTAKNAIRYFMGLEESKNVYFIFLNTEKFLENHPRVKYLDMITDAEEKVEFINTCDAMIHARQMGETFGLAVAEFSFMNKPIITTTCGDREHLHILGDRAIVFETIDDLLDILKNIRTRIAVRDDWNAYDAYSSERVMDKFKHLFLCNN